MHIKPFIQKDTAVITSLFQGNFVSSSAMFLHLFDRVPHVLLMRQFDYDKGYELLRQEFGDHIRNEYHSLELEGRRRKEQKVQSLIVLSEEIILEMGDNYCEFYYTRPDCPLLQELKKRFTAIRKAQRRKPLEINLITQGDSGLELTGLEVKRTNLNLDLYYEDDFKEVDDTIRRRLNKKRDKGIVLLHGSPGTGKTTYLRYLIGKIKKKVLFLPPDIAANIANPELIRLLIDYPDSVLIIEDAENIIMQRQAGMDSSVSNLLNISDGLMSDFLNIQLICTCNSPLSSIDHALMRKGRLIAKYEFGKLSVAKAQRLSDHVGQNCRIQHPMSVAEIFNQHEKTQEPERHVIGFRRAALVS